MAILISIIIFSSYLFYRSSKNINKNVENKIKIEVQDEVKRYFALKHEEIEENNNE